MLIDDDLNPKKKQKNELQNLKKRVEKQKERIIEPIKVSKL